MTFFPAGFDPRGPAAGLLHLANVNTPDGDFGFILGRDGKFTDVNGKVWWGSALFDMPALSMPINGKAPAGEIGMTFFQDPLLPDLTAQVQELGADYIRGRPLTFWVQPLNSHNELYAPVFAPELVTTREMRSIIFEATGPMQRRLVLTFETAFAGRNEARNWSYTTTDHARLLGGVANPSLQYRPTRYSREEKLF